MTQIKIETTSDGPKILIVGAGPTGLAAGYRLRELGYTNFSLLEGRYKVGGLASSERSPNGFIYDIGGHVLFSHYEYFDRLFDRLMGDEYQELLRRVVGVDVRSLPAVPVSEQHRVSAQGSRAGVPARAHRGAEAADRQDAVRELRGADSRRVRRWHREALHDAVQLQGVGTPAADDEQGVDRRARRHPADRAGAWQRGAGSRRRVLGPNATFKYPRYGGTGELFERMRPFVEEQLRSARRSWRWMSSASEVLLADGHREPFNILLSTMPLDMLVACPCDRPGLRAHAVRAPSAFGVVHSSAWGSSNRRRRTKCWMYFPEDNCPFYRVTYLSNYSPDVVPDPGRTTRCSPRSRTPSTSRWTARRSSSETIQGLVNTR